MLRLALSAALLLLAAPLLRANDVDDAIRNLGSPRFVERQAANEALRKLGERALPALEEAATSADAEVRRRAATLVHAIRSDLYREVKRLEGHVGPVWCVALSPDGRYALSGGGYDYAKRSEPDDCTLRLWDVGSGKELRHLEGHGATITGAAFSPDGRLAASVEESCTMVWDVQTGKELRHLLRGGRSVSFLGDSRHLVSGMALWDVATGEMVRDYLPEGLPAEVVTQACVAGSPDGRRLLFGTRTNPSLRPTPRRSWVRWELELHNLHALDVETGKWLSHTTGPIAVVSAVGLSPDGRAAFSWHDWGKSLYRIKLLEPPAEMRTTVLVWDPESGRRLDRWDPGKVCSVAFSPDGRQALTGGADGTVVLRDAKEGKLLWTFPGHQEPVSCLAYSLDGRFAISGGDDGTVRVWRLRK